MSYHPVSGEPRPRTLTWYLLRIVLHTPVTSIIVTRKGTAALFVILTDEELRRTGVRGKAAEVECHRSRFQSVRRDLVDGRALRYYYWK